MKKKIIVNQINVDNIIKNIKKGLRSKKKFDKEKFEKEIERHLISTNFKPLDGRTYYGKPIKKIAKVADVLLYILGCATLAFILVTVAIAWMSI